MTEHVTREFDLSGLLATPYYCLGCAGRLCGRLEGIEGVEGTDCDIAGGSVRVTFDPHRVSEDAIERALIELAREASESVSHAVYTLTGLDCPDCARTVDRSVGYVDGVLSASLNFASATLLVEFDPAHDPRDAIVALVRGMDYGIAPVGEPAGTQEPLGWWAEHRASMLVVASGTLLAFGWALGHTGLPEYVSVALLSGSILTGAIQPARRAMGALRARTLDMNVLMTLAVAGAVVLGDFTEAATIFFLFAIGGWLEARSLARTRRSIKDLMALAPDRARVRRSGSEALVEVRDVAVGETVIVRPGERIPLDGTVVRGASAVDESPVTGEPVPAEKGVGDDVFAGTLSTSGLIEFTTTATATSSTLARVVELVEEAQARKAPVQQLVDRFTRVYTPAVIALAVFLAIVPPGLGALGVAGLGDWSTWFYRALVLLVVSCPCALVISTPVAVVSAITAATKAGVLVKGGAVLENAARVGAIAFDKTGTLTVGKPVVTEIVAFGDLEPGELLRTAASLEIGSGHPLARAVVQAAGDDARLSDLDRFAEVPGQGTRGTIGGVEHLVGSPFFVESETTPFGGDVTEAQLRLEGAGMSVLAVARDGVVLGLIGLADAVRPQARQALARLRREGITQLIMLTGDNELTASAIAADVGVSEYRARLLPQDKMEEVEALAARYRIVAMVGDGINDAPALAVAGIGIAMGAAGSDTALETADVALMSDDLHALPGLFRLGRRTLRVIRQNVWFSVVVKAVVLVAAVFGYAPLWLAVFADTGVSLLVIVNGLRLLRVKV
jgi:Cd2+/Zn2+-exporting ATPase